MIYEEFKKQVEEICKNYNLTIKYSPGEEDFRILKFKKYGVQHYEVLGTISNLKENTANLQLEGFVINNSINKLLNLIIEFTGTPINERFSKKEYYLKHRYLYMHEGYLHVLKPCNTLGLGLKSSGKNHENIFKNTFTEQEIEHIKFKYCTDLKDFEIIPVEED